MDAEYILESADGLSIFGAEDPDWSAARAAERLAAREIANALDLFPSEAEELAADDKYLWWPHHIGSRFGFLRSYRQRGCEQYCAA